jgi:hypothetical protein
MIDLEYSLIIEATKEPDFFGFTSLICRVFQVSGIPSRIVFIKRNGG